jgi:hypothetical protein
VAGSVKSVSIRFVRDDFPVSLKGKLAARVGHTCSNPTCRALTSGPQLDEGQAVNVGVAAHITAASPGGPRYDTKLSTSQRCAALNAIWLCQLCAKLIDSDQSRYTEARLHGWKASAEADVARRLGKAQGSAVSQLATEQQKERELNLRDQMRRQLLKPFDPRKRQRDLFQHARAIIHALDDSTYPNAADGPDISGWFRVNLFDFYHNGIVVILSIYAGFLDCQDRWCVAEPGKPEPVNMPGFERVKVLHLGKIPFRNIRVFDPHGDEYYSGPHLYCTFSEIDGPYEGFEYRLYGPVHEPLLPEENRVEPMYRNDIAESSCGQDEIRPDCGPRGNAEP